MGCREGLCPFSGLWVLVDKNLLLGGLRQKPDAGWNLDKNRDKPRICFPKSKTRKTDTAINRIKAIGTCETVDCILRCKIPKIFNQKFPRFSICGECSMKMSPR